jgi:hypothetical protein
MALAMITASVKAADTESDFIGDMKQEHAEIEADIDRLSYTCHTSDQDVCDFSRQHIRSRLEMWMDILEMNRGDYSPEADAFIRAQLNWARETWQRFK